MTKNPVNKKISAFTQSNIQIHKLAIKPELIGSHHKFIFQDHQVKIRLPKLSQVERGGGNDFSIATVNAWDKDDSPLWFNIHQVFVEICVPGLIPVPVEALDRHPNAIDLFSDTQQQSLYKITDRHWIMSEKIIDYWLSIVRWKCYKSDIGRPVRYGEGITQSSSLFEKKQRKKIWIGMEGVNAIGRHIITENEWEKVEQAISEYQQIPVYISLKFEAEEYIKLEDYYRAIIDLAFASETFMRFFVLKQLPENLNTTLKKFIEEANIRQFINHFFAEYLEDNDLKHFQNLKKNLNKLFSTRNNIIHMGKIDGLTQNDCKKFLKTTSQLLALDRS